MWKTIKSEKIFENKWIKLFNDQIEFDNGKPGVYSYMDRTDGAHVIVIAPDKKIILFKQYRYPTKKYEWSIPGGGIDLDESPENAAKREVREELGIGIEKIEPIGVWVAQSSVSTEKLYMFVGWSNEPPMSVGLGDESITETRAFTKDEVLSMIDSGEITDPAISSAIQIVIRKYLQS